MTHPRTTLLALLCLALLGLPARAQLIERHVDIFSEGVRMGGYVLTPPLRLAGARWRHRAGHAAPAASRLPPTPARGWWATCAARP